MYIDSSTLRLALLKIFVESGAPADWRPYCDVAEAWRLTGLRGSDLRDAVHEMIEGGELVSAERDGALSLALSSELLHGMRQPDSYLRLGTLEEEITLLDLLFRDKPGPDHGLRRRVSDLMESPEEE
jgi:hypothetical protein